MGFTGDHCALRYDCLVRNSFGKCKMTDKYARSGEGDWTSVQPPTQLQKHGLERTERTALRTAVDAFIKYTQQNSGLAPQDEPKVYASTIDVEYLYTPRNCEKIKNAIGDMQNHASWNFSGKCVSAAVFWSKEQGSNMTVRFNTPAARPKWNVCFLGAVILAALMIFVSLFGFFDYTMMSM